MPAHRRLDSLCHGVGFPLSPGPWRTIPPFHLLRFGLLSQKGSSREQQPASVYCNGSARMRIGQDGQSQAIEVQKVLRNSGWVQMTSSLSVRTAFVQSVGWKIQTDGWPNDPHHCVDSAGNEKTLQ